MRFKTSLAARLREQGIEVVDLEGHDAKLNHQLVLPV